MKENMTEVINVPLDITTKIKHLALIAGVHGNELTTACLVKYLQENPHLVHNSSFETHYLIAHPSALERCVRYIEKDLNRCFAKKDLLNPNCHKYEELIAKNIYAEIKEREIDLIIDMHTTTSNMGLTIIYSNPHPFLLQLFAAIVTINPDVKLVYHPLTTEENCFLKGVCELGFTLEIGAIAQGIIDPNLFEKTKELVYQILNYIQHFNQRKTLQRETILTVYERISVLDYPRLHNNLVAMIHPNVMYKDYEPIMPNQPVFLSFDGQEIAYQGDTVVYPIFVGESAYQEKGIALCLTQKQELILNK